MAAWLARTSTWLVDHHWGPYLFALLLLLAFSEAAFFVGFVLPGETALVLGGALCATGVFPLALFGPAAVLAAIAGDSLGYLVGRRFGPRMRQSWAGRKLGEQRWAAAEWFFARHGGKAVFLGRAQAVLRALVPALAGSSGMAYRTFLRWNAMGALVWGGGVVLLGYAFAHSLATLETGLKYWGIGALLVLVGGFVVLRRVQKRAELEMAEQMRAYAGSQAGDVEAHEPLEGEV
jgi:membrane-associated protein